MVLKFNYGLTLRFYSCTTDCNWEICAIEYLQSDNTHGFQISILVLPFVVVDIKKISMRDGVSNQPRFLRKNPMNGAKIQNYA